MLSDLAIGLRESADNIISMLSIDIAKNTRVYFESTDIAHRRTRNYYRDAIRNAKASKNRTSTTQSYWNTANWSLAILKKTRSWTISDITKRIVICIFVFVLTYCIFPSFGGFNVPYIPFCTTMIDDLLAKFKLAKDRKQIIIYIQII